MFTNIIRKPLSIAIAIAMVFSMCCFSLDTDTAHAAKAKKGFAKTKISLYEGQFTALKLKGIKVTKAKWSSTSTRIAKVTKKGTVTAKKSGKCTIKAKYQKKTYKCKVTVLANTLNNNDLLMVVGDSYHLEFKYGKIKSATSSNEDVAKADLGGNVTATAAGDTVITLISKNNIKATCNVCVENPKLSAEKLTLEIGKSDTLKVTGTKQQITWVSSDDKIAEVKDGLVTAIDAGTATITAKLECGKILQCEVVVNKKEEEQEAETGGGGDSGGFSGGGGGGSTPTVTTTYIVTFETNGGSAVSSQTVTENECAVEPIVPTKDNCIFKGWYIDEEFAIAYVFDTPVTKDITLYAKWVTDSPELDDDVIDITDVETLFESGDIDVLYDDNGDVKSIDGPITNERVTDGTKAAAIMNSAKSLFGTSLTAQASDIRQDSVDVEEADKEITYRYSPTKDGVDVIGGQIILTTDDDGDVTGMYSGYNNNINSTNTNASITDKAAVEVVKDLILQEDGVKKSLESAITEEYDYDTIRESFLSLLDYKAEKVIYAANVETPILVYAVNVSNKSIDDVVANASKDSSNTTRNSLGVGNTTKKVPAADDVSGAIDSGNAITDVTTVMGEENEEKTEKSEEETVSFPSINSTYYIYASGDKAGELYNTISNLRTWDDITISAEDLKGNTKKINAQKEGSTYRIRDSKHNIRINKPFTWGSYTMEQLFPYFEDLYYIGIPGEYATFDSSLLDPVAVSLYDNFITTYYHYKMVCGRDSYDNKGAAIIAVYGCENYNGMGVNAFWSNDSSTCFAFGDGGIVKALDVVAHEFTHAVSGSIIGDGGLVYEKESGALNESYSDIMGCLIQNKSGDDRWAHRVDSDAGANRYMNNPTRDGVSIDNYKDYNDDIDVHYSSGILNYAAYKMMTDSRTSTISNYTWEKVFYTSLYKLTTTATFRDSEFAILSAAKRLKFTEKELQAIKDAFSDVGIK